MRPRLRSLTLALVAATSCSGGDAPPSPERRAPPAPAPAPLPVPAPLLESTVTQAEVAPSAPVPLPIPAHMLRPPPLPAHDGPLRPPNGVLVARGWRQPRITAGTSGAIVAYGRGTAAFPPTVSTRSECEWMEEATVLPWAAFDAEAAPPPPERECDRRSAGVRALVFDAAWEPVVVLCTGARDLRCAVRSLGEHTYPDFTLPARAGLPFLADMSGLPYQEISGALLGARGLTWVNSAAGREPVVTTLMPRLPFPCAPDGCSMSVLSGFGETEGLMEVTVVHRDGRRVEIRVDRSGRRAGEPVQDRQEGGDPLRRGPYAIDETRRLARRYTLATRNLDVPIPGTGSPVTSFDSATGTQGLLLAWIEGESPHERLRVAQMNMVGTDISGAATDLITDRDLGTVSIASLSDHTAVAWSERDGDTWLVRAAEVYARRSPTR